MAELVALAKAQPGKLSYGHAGVGTSQHLGAELFKYLAHLDIASVPYRGTTALMPDLLAALKAQGARFITLEEAQSDPVFDTDSGIALPHGENFLNTRLLARKLALL